MKKNLFSGTSTIILPTIISALVSFTITTYLDNKNREITLKPYLVSEIGFSENHERFGIVISNMGKGPAIIENSYINVNGIEYTFENKDPREVISSFLQQLGLYSSCREYLLVDFFPSKGLPIGDGRILDFLTIPSDSNKLELDKMRNVLLTSGKFSGSDIEKLISNYIAKYNNCRNDFIDTFSNPKKNIKMRLQYKSINDELDGMEKWHIIKTVKPL